VRALALLFALVTLLAAPAAFGQSQTREPDLADLWSEYPLDQSPAGVERLQSRERDGSTAGPPPRAPQAGGPIALAFLYVMLALTAVTVVLVLRRVVYLPRDLLGRLGRKRTR
jgi:hypothetical protein